MEYAPGNNGQVVAELRDFVTTTEHNFTNSTLDKLRQKKVDYGELIRKRESLEASNVDKMAKLEQKWFC